MRIRVHDGTPRGEDKPLCDSCRHSRIVRGRSLDEEMVWCDLPMRTMLMPFKVTSCTHYDDQRFPTYMEFMQTAWILKTGQKGRPAGFVPAREVQAEALEPFTWHPEKPKR